MRRFHEHFVIYSENKSELVADKKKFKALGLEAEVMIVCKKPKLYALEVFSEVDCVLETQEVIEAIYKYYKIDM